MSFERDHYNAVVVGAGPNGLAAAITLKRKFRSVLLAGGERNRRRRHPLGRAYDSRFHPRRLLRRQPAGPLFPFLPAARASIDTASNGSILKSRWHTLSGTGRPCASTGRSRQRPICWVLTAGPTGRCCSPSWRITRGSFRMSSSPSRFPKTRYSWPVSD